MKKRLLSSCIASALLSMTAGNAVAGLDEGLVAYYPFDGNALDASGNEHHGTVHGAALTEDRFGNSYSAYSFDGAAGKIVVQDAPLLNVGKTELSIAVWVKTTQTGIWKRIVTKRANTTAGNWYSLAVNSGKARFEIFPNGNLDSTTNVNDGNWHFIVITRNSSNDRFSMYVDGILESTMVDEGRNLNSGVDTSLEIGVWATEKYNGTIYNGFIDDIHIYNRSISEDEIQQLYNCTDSSCGMGDTEDDTGSCEEGCFTQKDIDAAHEAGKQACIDEPSSCGIEALPEGNCELATLSSGFKMHIPLLNYTPLAGDEAVMPLWVDMKITDANNLQFKVTDYGVIK